MRRNLFVVVLIPCILFCVLLLLIKMNKEQEAKRAAHKVTVSTETSGIIDQTESETESEATSSATTDAPVTTTTDSQTAMPTTEQTAAQTQTETTAPITIQTSASTVESQEDETSETTESIETNEVETKPSEADVEYDALYELKGEAYTLIADKNSKHFIFVSNQDNTIRETEFKYHEKHEQFPGEIYGPILGYKSNIFVFVADNKIVASDGNSETILINLDKSGLPEDYNINLVLHSDNRILSIINKDIYVIDCRTLFVEEYEENYKVEIILFTDDYLCFGEIRQIHAGSHYYYIYLVRDGELKHLGSTGTIDDYITDNDTIYIQSQDLLLQVNLKTSELTSSYQLGKEQALYFPVYGPCLIQGLSEIKYVNYNDDRQPVQSIKLPDFLEAECYYGSPFAIPGFSLYFKDQEKAMSLPAPGRLGSFSVIDLSEYPLKDDKFILHSTVKEKLYSGSTCMGEGEIYLLERVEMKNNDNVLFEMIYAWIPACESNAYQFFIFVPEGDSASVWFNVLKQLLQAD
ncbi:MAG: hypothetical protein GX045_09305 [Clostridiaceae bacterium]|nr:hypothetical protein [Clostridiaceae bacterium]